MGIRDREIERLESYFKALGIKLTYKASKNGDPGAEWYTDGSQIIVYRRSNDSKTSIILNMIHEGAHALEYIYSNKKHNQMLLDALIAEESRKNNDPYIDKSLRHLIYEDEVNAIHYREFIVKELDIKVDSVKIKMDIDIDKWSYYQYYIKGSHPNQKELQLKKQQLMKDYKK